MAEVFLAAESGEHALGRLLIIKRILPHLAEDAAFVEMFLQEARVAARINHPNVVQIYELGESGGFPYIAMEYIEGSTLKELLLASRDTHVSLPPGVVLHLIAQACAGAHAAHELKDRDGHDAGLVHRDLSPHNLMVTPKGHVKLLDFGIAKATESRMLEATRTGVLKGKISYMSPEQCRQDPLDRRSDIFALGIVAWELFAGRKLFAGMSELATMQAIVSGDLPDLRPLRPDVPDPVVHALNRALATDRDARYPTADAMRRALLKAAQASEIQVDADEAAELVTTLLGTDHNARRVQIDAQLEKTLVTLSAVRLPTAEASQTSLTQTANLVQASVMGAVGFMAAVGLAAVLALAAALIALFVYWPSPPPEVPGPVAEIVPAGEPVHIAIAAPTDIEGLRTDYEPLRHYLQTAIDRPVQLQFGKNYEAVQHALLNGSVQYASLPPVTFVDSLEREPRLQLLAIKQFDGSTGSDGLLLVTEDSTGDTVAAFKGSTMCLSDPLSTTGYILPRAYLLKHKLDPDVDFTPHISGNHYQVMRDLIAGVCEIGATYNGAYITADREYGIQKARLRLLVTTGRSPHDAITAGPAADPAITARLSAALTAFDPEEVVGKEQLGKIERITKFVPPKPDAYDSIRTARKLVLAHEARRKKSKGK